MRKPWAVFLVFVCFALEGQSPDETKKIEMLIARVASMQGAVFIRNGSEYPCADAAAHMRRKWDALRSRIKTARDFIQIAASASSMTGQPYLIRFQDGKTVKTADFLEMELRAIEKK
ncbi:MAG: DUF5329 domain-containing protein [Spirochaetia bacterium]|nr:DUF5329 domain-containing protein [Spirochaetia bacterium]